MIPVGVHDLNATTDRLFDRNRCIVGWGTGSYFEYFRSRFPVRLDFLIDNDRSRIGGTRAGTPIVGVERLLEEDPENTVVIIYSAAWPEIQQQLAALGPYRSVPASLLFADVDARERLSAAEEIASRAVKRTRPASTNAIVVQGPVVERVTLQVLRVLSAQNADDRIILSTWDDTPPHLLEQLAPYADDVVTSARPAIAGIQNRNLQIVSTRAGVQRAIDRGAQMILKTRTDLALLGEATFARARSWLSAVGEASARQHGLAGRFIVPSNYTRKYLLYHPSDLVVLGRADDMARLWSAPLDSRSGDLVSPTTLSQPLTDLCMSGNPAESYLGLSLCRSLDREALGTLTDSWAFYRDLFAVVDNNWFDMLWFKNLLMPDAAVRTGVRTLVTQAFWQRLYANDPTLERELNEATYHSLTFSALAGAA